jgi:GT2 family glycosyltransferase
MLQISLIVCTRGRPILLERLLRSLALQDYPEFELIVICDPKETETEHCLMCHARQAKIGHCGPANLARARNIGLSMAEGDIAAFIDDDAVPAPDWLTRLAACYAAPEITAAGGFVRARNAATFQNRFVLIDPFGKDHPAALLPSTLPAGWFLSLTGTNFSVRVANARSLGGFDENYHYFLEETDFLLRLGEAGGKIAVDPQAEVQHGYAESAIRTANGAPKCLHVIARSKAYFCHINRRPETSLAAINYALARFIAIKSCLLLSNFLLARLNVRAAARLLLELRTGIREGEALAKTGRSLAVFSSVSPAHRRASYLPK